MTEHRDRGSGPAAAAAANKLDSACVRVRGRSAVTRCPGRAPDSNSFAGVGWESTPLLLRVRATSTNRGRHPALLTVPAILDCRPLATVAQCCTAGTRASTYSPLVRSVGATRAHLEPVVENSNRVPAGSGSRWERCVSFRACALDGRGGRLCWAVQPPFLRRTGLAFAATPSPVGTQSRRPTRPAGGGSVTLAQR